MPHLEPHSFTCPTHGVDLTPLVEEAVEELALPVVFGKRTGQRVFEVLVSCPGTDTSQPPHQLACTGKYRR